MNIQTLVTQMAESAAKERSNYHLTYGQLIKALKEAPPDAMFDEKIKGIGSYRGSYIEIALFTQESGYCAFKEEYEGDYQGYDEWEKQNKVSGELPKNANEVGVLLESLLGLYFVGYKGGYFQIQEYKPLWLCEEQSYSGNTAVIGIDQNLNLVTKEITD